MKVTALIFCLAVVPFVAAQAPEESVSILGKVKAYVMGVMSDIREGTIDTERYRQDIAAGFNAASTKIQEGVNMTRDLLAEFEIEVKDIDLPDVNAMMAEIDTRVNELQTTIEEKMTIVRETVENFDPFGLDEEQEAEGNPEPEPTPPSEPEAEAKYSWPWW